MDMRSISLRYAEFAHDLKVPVQLISSCVQLLEDEFKANARTEGYLRTLARSADQLQSMLSHALEEEELRAGRRDVVGDARNLAREFELLADRKRVRVRFLSNASKFNLCTDGEKLRRILHNLLSNALRFTPAGGSIELRVQLMGDSVEFSVRDTGCGIPKEYQSRVFEDGFSTDGSGHGLAICRKYAAQLGGSLEMESVPGMGSGFTLRLPVSVEN